MSAFFIALGLVGLGLAVGALIVYAIIVATFMGMWR